MGSVVSSVSRGVTGFVGGFFGAVAGVVTDVISFIGDEILGLGLDDSSGNVKNAEQGVFLNDRLNINDIPVAYGRVRVGGLRVFGPYVTTSQRNMSRAFVLSEGPCNNVLNWYIDGVPFFFGRFSGLIADTDVLPGTDTQAASAQMLARFPPPAWTAADQGKGVCYHFITLRFDKDQFAGGEPTHWWDLEGRIVFDVRAQTQAWSRNPADIIYDYLTNTRYGRGVPASRVDLASFQDVANYCDELVDFPDGAGGTVQQARWTCDGLIDTATKRSSNMAKLLSSCRGHLLRTAGIHKLVVERDGSPVFSITEAMVIGNLKIRRGEIGEIFNRVTAEFTNEANNWQADEAIWDDETLRNGTDKGRLLETTVQRAFTKDLYRAQYHAQIALKNSRFDIRIQFVGTPDLTVLEPMDIIDFTHSAAGFVNFEARVISAKQRADGNVAIALKQHSNAGFTLDPLTDEDLTAGLEFPDVYVDFPPTNLQLAPSQTVKNGALWSSIEVTWLAGDDGFNLTTEIEYKRTADAEWLHWETVDISVLESLITNVDDGVAYDVRVRHINAAGTASSWTPSLNFVIPDSNIASDPGIAPAVSNPGFEAGNVGWDDGGSGAYSINQNAANSRTGSYYAEIGPQAGQQQFENAGSLAINKGDRIEATVYVNNHSSEGTPTPGEGQGYIGIEWLDADGISTGHDRFSPEVPHISSTTTWVKTSVIARSTLDADARARVALYREGSLDGGFTRFDDASLRVVSRAEDIVQITRYFDGIDYTDVRLWRDELDIISEGATMSVSLAPGDSGTSAVRLTDINPVDAFAVDFEAFYPYVFIPVDEDSLYRVSARTQYVSTGSATDVATISIGFVGFNADKSFEAFYPYAYNDADRSAQAGNVFFTKTGFAQGRTASPPAAPPLGYPLPGAPGQFSDNVRWIAPYIKFVTNGKENSYWELDYIDVQVDPPT